MGIQDMKELLNLIIWIEFSRFLSSLVIYYFSRGSEQLENDA